MKKVLVILSGVFFLMSFAGVGFSRVASACDGKECAHHKGGKDVKCACKDKEKGQCEKCQKGECRHCKMKGHCKEKKKCPYEKGEKGRDAESKEELKKDEKK